MGIMIQYYYALERQEVNMEKKVPERKVSLRDEDIIYIYDKRINRCIKEDCEGTVKYGLVLKVRVSEDETLNCFECNKCHMKYTPYPNYVRLTKTDMLTIYNQDEVTARDLKRAADAKKQALREKKSSREELKKKGGKGPGYKKNSSKRHFNKKYSNVSEKYIEKDVFDKNGKRTNIVITETESKKVYQKNRLFSDRKGDFVSYRKREY